MIIVSSNSSIIVNNKSTMKKSTKKNINEIKIGRKTNVRILQVTNLGNYTRDDLDRTKKGKPEEGNWISINQHNLHITLLARISLSLSLSLSLSVLIIHRSRHVLANCIQCPRRTDVDKFLQLGQLWPVHVKEFIGERLMSSSLLLPLYISILFVFLGWF